MKKTMLALLIAMLLVFSMAVTAFAEHGAPAGGCPEKYHLHHLMHHDHEGDHMHRHIGSDIDMNGDGYLCVKHVSSDGSLHVHIDNYLPLD